MMWTAILAATLGLVLTIPATIRTLDGESAESDGRTLAEASLGLGCLLFGSTALLLRGFDASGWSSVLAGLVLGAAGAAVTPELVQFGRQRAGTPHD